MLKTNRSGIRAGIVSALAVTTLAMLAGCSGGTSGGSGTPTVKSIQDAGVLRVATLTGDAPWVSVSAKGAQEGFDIDTANALAAKLGVKVEFTPVDGPGRVAALQSKKVDVTVGEFSNTPDRSKVIDFTKDYILNPGQYLVRADSGIATKEQLNDPSKKVCIGQGGTAAKLVPADLPKVGSLLLPGPDDCYEALKSGQSDAMSQTPFYYAPIMKKEPGKYAILEGSFGTNHIAIGLQKGSTALTKYVDDFLTEYQASGKLQSSFSKWFGFEMPANAQPDWYKN